MKIIERIKNTLWYIRVICLIVFFIGCSFLASFLGDNFSDFFRTNIYPAFIFVAFVLMGIISLGMWIAASLGNDKGRRLTYEVGDFALICPCGNRGRLNRTDDTSYIFECSTCNKSYKVKIF